MTEATAWAVIDGDSGMPLPATVHTHRRGAIANWLGVYGGIMPLSFWDDERIEREFEARRRRARIAEVVVVLKQ